MSVMNFTWYHKKRSWYWPVSNQLLVLDLTVLKTKVTRCYWNTGRMRFPSAFRRLHFPDDFLRQSLLKVPWLYWARITAYWYNVYSGLEKKNNKKTILLSTPKHFNERQTPRACRFLKLFLVFLLPISHKQTFQITNVFYCWKFSHTNLFIRTDRQAYFYGRLIRPFGLWSMSVCLNILILTLV